MSGDVEITRNKKHTALLIPQSAIEYEAGKYFVYISDNQKNAEPIKTLVKIGMRKDENVEILSGISTDDNIVIFTK
jgi:multidrug efflux pump subunit AcrA (membrane-fusion protein)